MSGEAGECPILAPGPAAVSLGRDGPDTVDLSEWQPGDTSTLGGRLLNLGHAHGVSGTKSATDLFRS